MNLSARLDAALNGDRMVDRSQSRGGIEVEAVSIETRTVRETRRAKTPGDS